MIKRNILLGLDIFLFLVIVQSFIIIFKDTLYDSDFRSFYIAGKIFLKDKDNLYNIQKQYNEQNALFKQLTDNESLPAASSGVSQRDKFFRAFIPAAELRGILARNKNFAFLAFVYPPIILIPSIPLTAFDFKTAHLIAFFALIIFLSIDIYLLLKIFSPKIPKYRIILLSLSVAPVIVTLGNIQYSIVLLLMFILVYIFIGKNKYFIAGLISSLLLLKLPLGLILFICILVFGKNKMRIGFVFGAVFVVLINLYLLDFNILPFLKINFWYATKVEVLSDLVLTMVSYQGLLAHFKSVLYFIPVSQVASILSLGTIIYMLITLFKLDGRLRFSPPAFALIIITTLLSSFHMHYHSAVILLFPLFWVYSMWNNLRIHLLVFAGWITLFFGTFTSYNPYLIFFHPTLLLLLIYWLLIRELNMLR